MNKAIMTAGHLAVAKEMGIPMTQEIAETISAHDLWTSTCVIGDNGQYAVYKTSKSITGSIHILTKLYVPKKYRGLGWASRLLDKCETPLVTSDKLRSIR